MPERIAAAVREEPRRGLGLVLGLAALVAALVLLVSGLSGASRAAAKGQRVARAADATGSLSPAQINAKVAGLLAQMTVAEKFGQLEMAGPSTPTGSDLVPLAEQGKIGSVLDLTGVDNINAVQAAAVKNSRLHIPLIFGLDVIHGYRTMFPVPLGEAASWDPALTSNDESVSADEASADGIKWTFNPMVDISRDPRWGRVVEGAGEDPVPGLGDRGREGTGLPGLGLLRPGQGGRDDQALRRLRRSGRRPRIQHGRHVDSAAVQRLPAALQGGCRCRRGDRDELVQLLEWCSQYRQPRLAHDDPSQ